MPTCSECGNAAVHFIISEIDNKMIVCPTDISLALISKGTGFTPQLVGMAFDDYIKKAIEANGYEIRKSGKPSRLQISKNNQ